MNNAFLILVQLGIGKGDSLSIPTSLNWKSIKTLATQHGLAAIVIDGIDKLPESLRPPKEHLLEWIGEVLQVYECRYESYRRTISELASFYNSHGYKMMVLKGYGLSLNYSNPNHRPCGDIDIWVFGKQQEADELMTKEYGISVDTSEHHHTVFYWQGNMVENHYDFLNIYASRTSRELEPLLKQLASDDSHCEEINGERVYTPSSDFNALFLLRHMLMHFVAIGINLRQILDWGFFWEKHCSEVNTEWLMGLLEKYGMKDFFGIANAICVNDLGFAAEIFPFVSEDRDMQLKVLDDVLCPRYDGRYAYRLSFFPRVLFKLRRWTGGLWKRKLCYKESMWTAFWIAAWGHLLKPSSI